MKKRVLSLILMVCLLLGMFPVAGLAAGAEEGSTADATVPFPDVKEEDWFYDGVRYSHANGFFTGTGGGNYDPDGTMSRAMFLTVLGRMAGIDEDDYAGDTGFVDVAEEAWYAPYVKWAVKYGITRGISEDIFSPDEPVSRQQMAVFFVRYLEAFDVETLTEEEITTTPADLDQAAPWAQEAVLKFWKMGFLNGDGTNFDPEGNATRAQTAVFCQRIDRGVDTWYVAPGQPSQRVSVEPDDATQKPTRRPSKNRTQYCSVSFEMGDGQNEIMLPQTQSVVKGSAVNALPTPYKAGVIFLGWYYDKDLTRAAAGSDTIDTNLTLYAKTTAGEEVQPLETPNYMTDTEVEAGEYRFEVYGASSEADLKFTNITGGNLAVDFTLNGNIVTATLEAGQTYQVELVKDTAEFVVDGQRQGTSIRYRNILTKKEESKQASLNRGVVQMPYSEEMGLASSVFQGLYTVDETNTVAENTTTGTFTYTNGVLNVGETVAIKKGNVDLDDPSSTEGDVAYLKIIGKNGNQYTYEMAEVEDVLFMPDVLPIQSDWDTDGDTTDNSITISAENLAKAMGQVEADSLDEGDYLGFLASGKAYNDSTADIESYGRITAFGDDGTGKYILTYTPATEEEIEKTLDVYYEQDREVTLGEEEIAEIEAEIKEDVENSGYAE